MRRIETTLGMELGTAMAVLPRGLVGATADGSDMPSVLVVATAPDHGDEFLRFLSTVLDAVPRADVLPLTGVSSWSLRISEAAAQLNDRVKLLPYPHSSHPSLFDGLRWGVHQGYDLLVQMHGDFSHDPRSIMSLLSIARSADVVIGSRYCPKGAVQGTRPLRSFVSRAANWIAGHLLQARSADATSGFICWRRDSLARLNLSIQGCHDAVARAYLIALASRTGARIVETPILFVEPARKRPFFSWRELVAASRDLVRLVRDKSRALPRLQPPSQNRQYWFTNKRTSSRRQRILVLALGGIGDTVMAFGMMRRLRLNFPAAQLTALAMWPQSADLLSDVGVFDKILQHHFQLEPWWKTLALARRLRREQFDIGIQCFPANRFEYNLVHRLIAPRHRIGHNYIVGSDVAYLRFLLTDRVLQTRGMHNIEENVKLLQPLGCTFTAGEIDARLGPVDAEYHAYAETFVGTSTVPCFGLHAGSSQYKNLGAKRWPAERFADLCEQVQQRYGWRPLLFGGRDDESINAAIHARVPTATVVRAPSIRHTAALIQRCQVFVTNDTAPGHIASALDVPTVMIVGPTNALEVGPRGPHGCVASAPTNCSPCFFVSRRPLICTHPTPFACMNGVSVDAVMMEVERLIAWPSKRALPVLDPKAPAAMSRATGREVVA